MLTLAQLTAAEKMYPLGSKASWSSCKIRAKFSWNYILSLIKTYSGPHLVFRVITVSSSGIFPVKVKTIKVVFFDKGDNLFNQNCSFRGTGKHFRELQGTFVPSTQTDQNFQVAVLLFQVDETLETVFIKLSMRLRKRLCEKITLTETIRVGFPRIQNI